VFAFIRRDGVRHAALMKNARADFRRAQFRLWIFSYTILPRSSKKRLSRLMIDTDAKIASAIGHPSDKSGSLQSVDRNGTKEFNQKVVPCS
jgi:hypothetical protein